MASQGPKASASSARLSPLARREGQGEEGTAEDHGCQPSRPSQARGRPGASHRRARARPGRAMLLRPGHGVKRAGSPGTRQPRSRSARGGRAWAKCGGHDAEAGERQGQDVPASGHAPRRSVPGAGATSPIAVRRRAVAGGRVEKARTAMRPPPSSARRGSQPIGAPQMPASSPLPSHDQSGMVSPAPSVAPQAPQRERPTRKPVEHGPARRQGAEEGADGKPRGRLRRRAASPRRGPARAPARPDRPAAGMARSPGMGRARGKGSSPRRSPPS